MKRNYIDACYVQGIRGDWQSAKKSPWKTSSVKHPLGTDAPQVDYNSLEDALKEIDALPSGDHLHVLDKERGSWNSGSYSLGTAGANGKSSWNSAQGQVNAPRDDPCDFSKWPSWAFVAPLAHDL